MFGRSSRTAYPETFGPAANNASGRTVTVMRSRSVRHYYLPDRCAKSDTRLEDAIVLARCLRDAAGYRAAFAVYQRLRQPRAERMVSYAQEVNKYKRISTNPIAVWLRDALVPLFLRKAASDTTNRWIYDYQIDWDVCLGKEREYAQAH